MADDPVRQKELVDIAHAIETGFSGLSVLDVACGTGYWTEIAARVANSVIAIDTSEEMLSIARQKHSRENIAFSYGNAYALSNIPGEFNAGLANFWLSHVPKSRLKEFLDGLHRRLKRPAVMLMADNVYVPGIGGPIIRKPSVEDTFKLRQLPDGSQYEVLRNYYNRVTLTHLFSTVSVDLEIYEGQHYWWIRYSLT